MLVPGADGIALAPADKKESKREEECPHITLKKIL
jgi:hypothetical protein